MEKIPKTIQREEKIPQEVVSGNKSPENKIKSYFTEYLLDQINMSLYDKWFQFRLFNRELINPKSQYNQLVTELKYKNKFEEEHKNDPIEYDIEIIEQQAVDENGNVIYEEVTKVETSQGDMVAREPKINKIEKRIPKEGLINKEFLARKAQVQSYVDQIEGDVAKMLKEMESIMMSKDLLLDIINNKDYEKLVDVDTVLKSYIEENKDIVKKFYK